MFFFCCWPCKSAETLYQEGLEKLENVPASVYNPQNNSLEAPKNKIFLESAAKLISALRILKAAADKDNFSARTTLYKQLSQVNNEQLAELIFGVFKDKLESEARNQGTYLERVRLISKSYSVVV